jgi:hypothetical protein
MILRHNSKVIPILKPKQIFKYPKTFTYLVIIFNSFNFCAIILNSSISVNLCQEMPIIYKALISLNSKSHTNSVILIIIAVTLKSL